MAIHQATKQMIDDVCDLVIKGKGVPTAPGEWVLDSSTKSLMKQSTSFVGRNKRKIVLTAAALIVTGILTGGLSVAVAAAAKLGSYVAGRIYRGMRDDHNKGMIKWFFRDMVDEKTREFKIGDFAVGSGGNASSKFKNVFKYVQEFIAHKDLSNLVNCFSELMENAKAFETKYDLYHSNGFTSCEQAIKTLENVYKYNYHMERVRPAMNFLDNYIMFIVLESSRMEAEFAEECPKMLKLLKSKARGLEMEFLNRCANSSAVLHTRWYSSEQNYKDWVRAVLHPWISEIQGTIVQNKISGEATLPTTILSSASNAIPTTAVSFGGSQAVTQSIKQVVTVQSTSMATSIATGGGEAVVSLVSEIANAKWNASMYSSGKTLGLTGWRDQSASERIANIKTLLKPSLERLTTKFEHYLVSHEEFMAAMKANSDLETICTKALRSRKHWSQSVGSDAYKYLAEFHQTIIGLVNVEGEKVFGDAKRAEKYEKFVKSGGKYAEASTISNAEDIKTCRLDLIQDKVDELLYKKHKVTIDPCSGYCYMPIKYVSNHWTWVPSPKTQDPGILNLAIKSINDLPKQTTV